MNLSRARRPALVPVVAALLLSACSEHSDGPTEPINEGDVAAVSIRDFAFSAPTITIDRGTSVRWRSTTGTFHTVTPDGHQAFAARHCDHVGSTLILRSIRR